jgi:hypothetical protein
MDRGKKLIDITLSLFLVSSSANTTFKSYDDVLGCISVRISHILKVHIDAILILLKPDLNCVVLG